MLNQTTQVKTPVQPDLSYVTSPGFSSNSSRRTFPIGTLACRVILTIKMIILIRAKKWETPNRILWTHTKNIIDLTSDECTVSKITLQNNPDHKLNEHPYSDKEARNALDLPVQSPSKPCLLIQASSWRYPKLLKIL